jgi:hypothetical protein
VIVRTRRAKQAHMTHRRMALVGAVSLLAIGCAAETHYTASSSLRAQPKPDNCSFEVLSTRPQRLFEELGIIDFTGGVIYQNGHRSGVPDSASALKDKAAQTVCRAGGDALLADVNGLGEYVRATVIRYTPQ